MGTEEYIDFLDKAPGKPTFDLVNVARASKLHAEAPYTCVVWDALVLHLSGCVSCASYL